MEDKKINPYNLDTPHGYNMQRFDSLPKEIRRQIANSANCQHNETPVDIQCSAQWYYDGNHPQAQGEFCCPLKP